MDCVNYTGKTYGAIGPELKEIIQLVLYDMVSQRANTNCYLNILHTDEICDILDYNPQSYRI